MVLQHAFQRRRLERWQGVVLAILVLLMGSVLLQDVSGRGGLPEGLQDFANSGAYFPLPLVSGILFPKPKDVKHFLKFCLLVSSFAYQWRSTRSGNRSLDSMLSSSTMIESLIQSNHSAAVFIALRSFLDMLSHLYLLHRCPCHDVNFGFGTPVPASRERSFRPVRSVMFPCRFRYSAIAWTRSDRDCCRSRITFRIPSFTILPSRSIVVMTLNHFERIGCLEKLAKRREHAYLRHRLQMPYLNGSDSYPVPIPQSAAGLGAASSALPDQPVL
jgi:hypothetical protein